MLLHAGLVFAFGVSAISAVTITASDLPECAVECYCYTGEKVKIAVTDYEKQCRSAPFQLALRECAEKKCNEEEYAFVCSPWKFNLRRPNIKQKNTVLNLE
jgi:CFEM domain